MPKITPFLWFEGVAEEAMNHYVSIFPNSKITSIDRIPSEEVGVDGMVVTGTFELDGREFMALNAGPHDKFNDSISFYVDCKSQEEVDYYWEKLLAGGGRETQCGWLKDKYGMSWQIVPDELNTLMSSGTPEQTQRVVQAMLQMVKLDVQKLRDAYHGK